MKIDFSEPECSNCFHCRILNTLESEPSNVLASSVNSTPVNSEPVQALEHASAAVGSTSTSSPVQAVGHESAAVSSTSTSYPIQALGHESSSVGSTSTSSPVQALSHDSAAVGSTSTSSPVQALGHDDSAAVGSTSTSSPVQALGDDDSAATGSISTFSFGSQTPSAPPVITSVCSEPVQTLAPTSLRSDVFGSPFQTTSGSGASATSTSLTSSPFQSSSPSRFLFAPAIASFSSAPTQAFGPNGFGFGAFSDPTHPRLGSMQAPVQATSGFGASVTSTSSTSSPVQSSSSFGFAPAVTSVSSAPTQAFGQTTFGFGSSPNSFGSAPAVTSVSSAPTQAFGPNTCGFSLFAAPTQPRHGSMQAPAQATSGFNLFAAPTQPKLGSMQATFAAQTPSSPVEATFGSGASGTSTSNSFLPFGSIPAPPTNASSLFRPMLNSLWTTNSLSTGGSVDWGRSDVGVLPATSSNLFGPNPSTPTEVFGAKPGSVSWPAQDYPRTGVNRFALHSSPSKLFGQNIPPTGSYPGFPGYGVDYLPGSNSNPFGPNPYTTGDGSSFGGPKTSSPQPFGFNAATTPRYAPTPDGVKGGMYTSISASMSHQHKSHEELRWEDYKKGNKGSKTNAVFAFPQMASPSIFASPSVPDYPQRTAFGTTQESFTGPVSVFPQHNPSFTGFGTQFPNSSSAFFTTFPPINSSVQRPHETASFSSPASRCTACGATTSTSASGYSTFNGATLTPPLAATTSLPGLFCHMYGSVPMMFGTSPAAQVTTPVLQAYPVNGYILLPFAAMKLQ